MRFKTKNQQKSTWQSVSGRNTPSPSAILRTTLLLMLTFIVLAPVTWFILSSFKDLTDLSSRPPKLFPTAWQFSNYTEAFKMYDYKKYFFNSVFVTVVATLLTL